MQERGDRGRNTKRAVYDNAANHILADDKAREYAARQILPPRQAEKTVRKLKARNAASKTQTPVTNPDPRGNHGFWI